MTVKLFNAAIAKGMLTKEFYKNIAAQTAQFFITTKNTFSSDEYNSDLSVLDLEIF